MTTILADSICNSFTDCLCVFPKDCNNQLWKCKKQPCNKFPPPANEQPIKKVQDVIEESLDKDLPDSYDKTSFEAKTKLILNHFVDMAVQGYGWIAEVA